MADVPKDDAPLGTRGRPGRGTGKATPSSAARSLAGPAKKTAAKKTAAKKTAAKKTAAAKPAKKTTEAAGSPVEPETSAVQIAPKVDVPPIGSPVELISVTPQEMPSPPESPEPPEPEPVAPRLELIRNDGEDDDADASTPPTGIPLSDWVSALTEGAQSVLGEDWESKAAQLLAQLRRRLTGDYEIDSFGLDPQLHAIGMAALRPIAEKWFRIEVRGAERIPSDGGALVVANHSGTIPVDAAMTTLVVNDHAHRTLRLLGADLVFTLPFVGELARKMGATLACSEDAERLLAEGHIVAVWPEGFKGVGKPYSERYKLQRFGRGGFVSAAMRAGVPIVPVSIVGAEEIYPLVGNVPSLARLLGLPYMPITPFFPWLGPLGMIPLPSKWIIEFGDPIRTDAYPPEAADDPMLVFNVTDQVRETIQQTLYALLVDRGHPFI
ncbi:lysophospholipid acyltransferase family protein [Mumia sp. ZJ1417]|uniref:lysophospholipid acyltransferase family protein n=1 Tax=Mumia sp. ZJ1417 TaxID=2708082 RepID=UPI001FB8D31A|nr:lysophospholipid acyltransferase family protein [Mumia sp. ZJ1417]